MDDLSLGRGHHHPDRRVLESCTEELLALAQGVFGTVAVGDVVEESKRSDDRALRVALRHLDVEHPDGVSACGAEPVLRGEGPVRFGGAGVQLGDRTVAVVRVHEPVPNVRSDPVGRRISGELLDLRADEARLEFLARDRRTLGIHDEGQALDQVPLSALDLAEGGLRRLAGADVAEHRLDAGWGTAVVHQAARDLDRYAFAVPREELVLVDAAPRFTGDLDVRRGDDDRVPLLGDEAQERLADELVAGVPHDVLESCVDARDAFVEVDRRDEIVGILDELAVALLAVSQRVFDPVAVGDVEHEAARMVETALLIEHGHLLVEDPDNTSVGGDHSVLPADSLAAVSRAVEVAENALAIVGMDDRLPETGADPLLGRIAEQRLCLRADEDGVEVV